MASGKRKTLPSSATEDVHDASRKKPKTTLQFSVDEVLQGLGDRSHLFQRPVTVAGMSRNKERQWKHSDWSAHGALNEKALKEWLPLDLDVGFEDFEKHWTHSEPDSLEHLLRGIRSTKFDQKPRHVVAWRGILTKIMCTPFLRRDEWEFAAWKCNNVLYLSNRETKEKIEQDANMPRTLKRFMYFGYKFEEICTRPAEDGTARRVDPAECFCKIFKTAVGDIKLFAGAEMDCFEEENKTEVELKVTRHMNGKQRLVRNFERFKLLKFWAQSFLAGVPKILIGFRDDEGIVSKVQSLETLKIPKTGNCAQFWNHKTCINFLGEILRLLIRIVPDETKDTVNSSDVFVLKHSEGLLLFSQSQRMQEREVFDPTLYCWESEIKSTDRAC